MQRAHDPGRPWTALDPQPQFDHKLLITHGASCGVSYAPANAPSVTSYNPTDLLGLPVSTPPGVFGDSVEFALGQGYVVMSTALGNSGHDCDVTTQAESLVMAKEHVIEAYGTLRYTIGTGCSGGSLAQQWIANAYPGIYQGILPTCSFPDTWSSATQVMDYHVLRAYFGHPDTWGAGVAWSPTQFGAVEGNPLPVDAIVSDVGFFDAIVPTHACPGVGAGQLYDPQANPGGVRCSIADLGVNVFGRRPLSVWTPVEQALGHGFAGVPVDNVGVQYGLAALRAGTITPAQFADLNARIGGLSMTSSRRRPRDGPLARRRRARHVRRVARAEDRHRQARRPRRHVPQRVGQVVAKGLCAHAVVPVYGTPRMVAGDAITTDANKRRLRPLDRATEGATFSDAEWASLQATFPDGVCDFSRPGGDQQGTVPWLGYQDRSGRVITGGRPLGPVPHSVALRRRAGG